MATIAPGLNFRIGADVKGINKAIKEAEKSLQGAVQSFSSIGNSLSLALSAPLAAFGVMSVKAAGQMESLRFALEGTMKDAGRSVGEARNELEALRVAALAPGLDFEQAVRGSVRLQSVGKSAEEARRIIVQLGNALALSGGTADQLDGVTRQFTQMIGKGKIMQEDMTIILENMPALAKVMQDTFGTTNAEMLRDMGVSVEDFIAKLTTGMEALPRAQGGIANSIVNAQNAIQQALASTGEEINRVFNISGALNSFSGWVSGLAASFKALDDDTKRVIGAVVVFAATLGPAFKVMQGGVWVVGQLQLAFLGLQKVLAQSMAGQAIPSLMAKWRAMDLMMKTSVIGATVAVVLALAAAFVVLQKDMSAAAQAQRQVEDVRKSAQESIVSETTRTKELVGVIQDSKSSYDQKRAALQELQKISPEYFGNLDTEKIKVTDVEMANNKYTDSLLRAAMARAAMAQIEENARKRLNMKEETEPGFWQSAGNAILSLGNSFAFAGMQAKTTAKNIEEQKAALDASDEAMRKVIAENGSMVEASKDQYEKTSKASKTYLEVLSDINNVFAQQELLGGEDIIEQAKAIEGGIKKLLDAGFAPLSKEVQHLKSKMKDVFSGAGVITMPTVGTIDPSGVSHLKDQYKGLADSARIATSAMQQNLTVAGQAAAIYAGIRAGTDGLSASMQALSQSMIQNGNLIGGIMVTLGDSIAQAGAKGAASLADFAKAALASAAKVIRAWIQMAVTRAALSALQSIPFPFNIAAAAAAGGIAAGLFNAAINKIGIPALAEGGVLTSPRLVMAGEYPGARTNPEIVTPENKMRDVMGEMLQRFGGAGGGTLTARVSGDDLLFILEKAKVKQTRMR